MLAKTSKVSSDQTKSGRSLLAVLFVEGPQIAQLVTDLVSPHRHEADPGPDFWGTLIAIARKLQHAVDRVVSADEELFAANAAVEAARQLRDERTKALNRQIMSLRGACNALFVNLSVKELGFDQRTFQDPSPLLMQADRIVKHLRGGDFDRAEYVFEGDDFDPSKYADRIEASAVALRATLDGLAEANKLAQSKMLAKRELTDDSQGVYLHGAQVFESCCRLVGKDALADRVRPSSPQSSRGESEPKGAADASPADDPEQEAAVEKVAGEVSARDAESVQT